MVLAIIIEVIIIRFMSITFIMEQTIIVEAIIIIEIKKELKIIYLNYYYLEYIHFIIIIISASNYHQYFK
jgi:hypothetical protein